MLNGGNIFSRDETIISYDKKFAIEENNEELIFLNDQGESDGKTSKTIKEMEDHNFILIENEEIVSISYACDKEEYSEDCRKLLGEIPSEMENFWQELSILEKRLEDQKVGVQGVKSKLNENEEVHYNGQGQKYIIRIDGVEERLADSLMNSTENSNMHIDVLIEEEKTEQQVELFPKKEKAQKPYVFYFNNFFVSATLVADAGGILAQMRSQIKMEEEDSMEEFNPWNRGVQLLERMLDNHDSMHIGIILTKGKDERQTIKVSVGLKEIA